MEERVNIFYSPGGFDLSRFQTHGGGIALFLAYVARRKADAKSNANRRAVLIQESESGAGWDRHHVIADELLMLQILAELDPLVSDLVTFCNAPGPVCDQLVNLRSALRIGKGHAPSDSAVAVRVWAICTEWVKAYGQMESDKIFLSENAIAEKIAQKIKVSRSTAINHWRELKTSQPAQAKWASEIANISLGVKRRQASSATQLSTKKITAKSRRITFGKGV